MNLYLLAVNWIDFLDSLKMLIKPVGAIISLLRAKIYLVDAYFHTDFIHEDEMEYPVNFF